MLEKIHGIPKRIADLQRKLEAREGKIEYGENVQAIRDEIVRLETLTMNREALEQFAADEAVASNPVKGDVS